MFCDEEYKKKWADLVAMVGREPKVPEYSSFAMSRECNFCGSTEPKANSVRMGHLLKSQPHTMEAKEQ